MQQGVALAPGPPSYVYLGSRVVRGWAIELVLIGALLPFLAATVDLFARCRRRRIRIAPALRSYRSRLALLALVRRASSALFALARRLAAAAPRGRRRSHVVHWPSGRADRRSPSLAGARLARRPRPAAPAAPVRAEEELAGHTGALLALGVVALLVVATNPFALVFLLPSLHVWLWLPQVRESPALVRVLVLARRLRRPRAPPLVVRRPLRARLGRAVVRRLALRARLRAAAGAS